VLALAIAVAGVAGVSGHRQDEYLQAARIALDPAGVQIELDLTPGIALADAIVAEIDRDRDGSLSHEEQRAYATLVLTGLKLEVDGHPLRAQLGASSFPDRGAMRRGEGTIRLFLAATFPRLSAGYHQLFFRNGHQPGRSVYLANALVPESDAVAVRGQRRDDVQSELTIDYILSEASSTSRAAWLLGSAAAMGLAALLLAPLAFPRRLETGS
jgi:hypothetical protein